MQVSQPWKDNDGSKNWVNQATSWWDKQWKSKGWKTSWADVTEAENDHPFKILQSMEAVDSEDELWFGKSAEDMEGGKASGGAADAVLGASPEPVPSDSQTNATPSQPGITIPRRN